MLDPAWSDTQLAFSYLPQFILPTGLENIYSWRLRRMSNHCRFLDKLDFEKSVPRCSGQLQMPKLERDSCAPFGHILSAIIDRCSNSEQSLSLYGRLIEPGLTPCGSRDSTSTLSCSWFWHLADSSDKFGTIGPHNNESGTFYRCLAVIIWNLLFQLVRYNCWFLSFENASCSLVGDIF